MGRVSISEPGRESANTVDQNGQAALDLAELVVPVTNSPVSSDFSRDIHEARRLRGVAADDGVAVAVFHGDDGHGDKLTHLHFELALVALEFGDGHIGFGLEAGVHDDKAVLQAHDFGGNDFTNTGFGVLL